MNFDKLTDFAITVVLAAALMGNLSGFMLNGLSCCMRLGHRPGEVQRFSNKDNY